MAQFSSADAVFAAMTAGLAADPSIKKKIKATIYYVVDGKKWFFSTKQTPATGFGSPSGRTDLTVEMSGATLLTLANGKQNPQQAFMKGKIKLRGNMGIAMKLQTVISAARKYLESGNVPTTGAAAGGAASGGAASGGSGGGLSLPSGLQSKPFLLQMEEAIRSKGPELQRKLKGVIVFELKSPDATMTLDLKSSSPSLSSGAPAAGTKRDLTLTLKDADFCAMGKGTLNPQQAFMKGRLKLKGNMGMAMKLGTVIKAAQSSAKL